MSRRGALDDRIRIAFALLLALLAAAWLASVHAGGLPTGFWPLRGLLIPFTGILAIGMMPAAVLLAVRPGLRTGVTPMSGSAGRARSATPCARA